MAVSGYSRTQIILHWAVVFILVPQFLLSGAIGESFRQGLETDTWIITPPVIGHIVWGLLILLIVLWRLTLRGRRGTPPPPESSPAWQRQSAHAVHLGLYGALILLPVSGATAWLFAAEGAAQVHGILRGVFLALVILHVAGALFSHYGQKSQVINRMMKARP